MATCRCSMLELQEEFIIQDLGTLYLKIRSKKRKLVKETAATLDGTIDIENVVEEDEPEAAKGFTHKVDITTVSHSRHMYNLIHNFGLTYMFKPTRERILFDSKELTSRVDHMLAFVAYCKKVHSDVIILEPRKRLAFECNSFDEIYHISYFCMENGIRDGRFYSTDISVVRKRNFVRGHRVQYTDYPPM